MQRRKYETVDKIALYVAGAAITAMMAMQINIAEKTTQISRGNLVELARVSEALSSVILNQNELQDTVRVIRMQTAITCERLKIIYPDRGYECK